MLDTQVARWQRDFAAVPANVADARRAATAWASEQGVPDEVVRDMALALSEAATNAVVHAFVDREPGILRVICEPADDAVVLRVLDDGRGMMPRSDSPGLGLGLPTISQLTEVFDIRDGLGERGTEVRMVFAAPGLRAPARPEPHEDWRFELLAEVSRLAGSGWPGPGVERLVELLVPRVADACAVDLVEQGVLHRLAARIDDDEELSAWLAARRPPANALEEILSALQRGEVRTIEVDAQSNARLAEREGDEERMAQADLTWWVNVPLTDGDVLLGSLGLGLRSTRPPPQDQLPFLTALGERAARGLANTQLVDELRRTRERLEAILAVLSEAVTVHDTEGRFVFANAAAVRLVGAASPEEFLAAQPGELMARFEVTRPDGEPVALADLPGHRLIAGLPAEPLLTRSVEKASGRVHWLVTRATLLEGDEPLVVNVIEEFLSREEAERRLGRRVEGG